MPFKWASASRDTDIGLSAFGRKKPHLGKWPNSSPFSSQLDWQVPGNGFLAGKVGSWGAS